MIDPLGLKNYGGKDGWKNFSNDLSGSNQSSSPGSNTKLSFPSMDDRIKSAQDLSKWYMDQSGIIDALNTSEWWWPTNWSDTATWWVGYPLFNELNRDSEFFDPWGKDKFNDDC